MSSGSKRIVAVAGLRIEWCCDCNHERSATPVRVGDHPTIANSGSVCRSYGY